MRVLKRWGSMLTVGDVSAWIVTQLLLLAVDTVLVADIRDKMQRLVCERRK